MLEYVNFNNAVGKTIKEIDGTTDETYITFTDGTFSAIRSEHDYEDTQVVFPERNTICVPNGHVAIKLGINTQEEYEEDQKRQKEAWVERQKQIDLARLKELKNKYET